MLRMNSYDVTWESDAFVWQLREQFLCISMLPQWFMCCSVYFYNVHALLKIQKYLNHFAVCNLWRLLVKGGPASYL